MNGHSILTDDFVICVDKWDASYLRRPGSLPHYFFLTHLHADHIKGLTSTWSRLIYTSPFNAWLLPRRRSVKPILLKELDLNVTHTIQKSNGGAAFRVTLLDANHCPGAVMFLFQGPFGNILYTGDFRYCPEILDNPVLLPLIRKKEIKTLYLDNTYAASSCNFPSREDALQEVMQIIDKYPDHKILVGIRQLGKEEVLRAIALHLNERVCVAPQRMEILEKLEYEDVFTIDTSHSRIHAVEMHTITQGICRENGKVISIKLTSMYECANLDQRRGNMYVVPYSDHSSHSELKQFVEKIRPENIIPIVQPKLLSAASSAGSWSKMSTVNCVIPEDIWALCGPSLHLIPSPDNSPNKLSLTIKFHPPPRETSMECKSRNVNHIDDGMNVLPFDSSGPHFTIKNTARKHIKASWTRLAPKILSPKGITFTKIPPGKRKETSPGKSLNNCIEPELKKLGLETSKDARLRLSLPDVEIRLSSDEGSLHEVPLSEEEEDLDMPSSAGDLRRRMQSSTKAIMTIGKISEEKLNHLLKKSQKSPENHPTLRRHHVSETADISCVVVKPCKGSLSPDDDSANVNHLKGRKKTNSDVDPKADVKEKVSPIQCLESGSPKRTQKALTSQILTRRNLKGTSSTTLSGVDTSGADLGKGVILRSGSKESLNKISPCKILESSDSSIKKMNSRGSISPRPRGETRVSPRLENKGLTKGAQSKATAGKSEENESVPRLSSQLKGSPPKEVSGAQLCKADSPKSRKGASSTLKPNGSMPKEGIVDHKTVTPSQINQQTNIEHTKDTESPINVESQSSSCILKTVTRNGTSVAAMNGIHINSPGRRRINCDWDVAQEIVRKETEEALKALESLNALKVKKLNKPISKDTVKARRLSADSAIQARNIASAAASTSSSKLQLRTTNILKSMASSFQVQSGRKLKADKKSTIIQGSKSSSSASKSIQATEKSKPLTEEGLAQVNKKSSNLSGVKTSKPAQSEASSSSSEVSQIHYVESVKVESPVLVSNVPRVTDQTLEFPENSVQSYRLDTEAPLEEYVNIIPKEEQNLPFTKQEEIQSQFVEPLTIIENLPLNESISNQSLFLNDSALASVDLTDITKDWMRIPPNFSEKEDLVNVGLMRLKVDFAMSSTKKGPRAPLPSRISSLRQSSHAGASSPAPLQSKEKVQAWKNKISLTLTKSPHRRLRLRTLLKPKQGGKSTVSRLPRKNLPPNLSQNYLGDVEDIDLDEVSEVGPSPPHAELFEGNSDYFADGESVYDRAVDSTDAPKTPSKNLDAVPTENLSLLDIVNESHKISENQYKPLSPPPKSVSNERLSIQQSEIDQKAGGKKRRSLRLQKDDGSDLILEQNVIPTHGRISSKNIFGKNDKTGSRKSTQNPRMVSTSFKGSVGNSKDRDECSSHLNVTSTPSPASSANLNVKEISCVNEEIDNNPQGTSHQINLATSLSESSKTDLATVGDNNSDGVEDGSNPKSSIILGLMADAFKASLPVNKSSTTVGILSPKANNIYSFDERNQGSSLVRIQVTSPPRAPNPASRASAEQDWSIKIIPEPDCPEQRRSSSPLKWSSSSESRLSLRKLTGVRTPESLSIELLPEKSTSPQPMKRKEPSPPSVSISMDSSCELIDLTDDESGKVPQRASARSLTSHSRSYHSRSLHSKARPSEVQSPPQSVWRERRSSGHSVANVININIETEEREREPHCPVHCTCGTGANRQGLCEGTASHLRGRETDSLFEVPLSPEDFESSGAMVALGRNWLESCFDNARDRDEFFQAHEGYLHILDNREKCAAKHALTSHPSQSHVKQVVKDSQGLNVVHSSGGDPPEPNDSFHGSSSGKDAKPQKRSSTDSERSESLLKEIEKKIRAYNDQQARRHSEGRSSQNRRGSLESRSSVGSAGKRNSISSTVKKKSIESKKDGNVACSQKPSVAASKRTHEHVSPSVSSEAHEVKKPRLTELERLMELGKNANRRYRMSVRRSLDNLMARQKLRSNKRVKKPTVSSF